ncbi:MAG: TonB-dependent receptor [Saprospiraceae bacterium]|nr:TonB-dependent receptor [Saprospiraceae bacterium]
MMYNTNKRWFLMLLYVVSLTSITMAQNVIKGSITDLANNEAIIGASIEEKGSTNGTISDVDGSFTINVQNAQAVLVIKYLGYNDEEINLNGQKEINVKMTESSILIDQVVVVGYGVQKKSDLTGAVSSLKGSELARVTSPNIEQALQGKITGVNVTPASGAPGAGAVIRIRGTGTLNNSNPLYVIDGMITEDASSVNPQDVESIEVLKDASSAAIYGSRGANGVILITTKNGKKRKNAQLSFSTYYGQQEVIRKIPLLNGSQFAKAYNQLRGQNYFTNPDSLGKGTDWQSEIFRSAPIASMQFGANGASENVSYNFSSNYFNQDGILKNTSFERGTFRLNTEMKLKSWLTIGNNTSYAITKEQLGPNVTSAAYQIPSTLSVFDSKGDFTDPTFFGLAIANPVADQFYKSNRFKNGSQLLGNMFGEISFLKNFKFRSNFGYNFTDSKFRNIEPKYKVSASQLNNSDRLTIERDGNKNWIWEQTLNFFKEWKNHTLGVLVGYTAEQRTFEKIGASRQNFPGTADELFYLSSGNDTTQTNYGELSDEALNSILFRTNYALNDKYLFTASMRVDKSSRFTPDNRTGYFPSGSVGWNLGRESFVEKLHAFDRLKLRASYGILGNQALTNRYPTSAIINSNLYGVFGSGENINQGATQLSISNPKLKWEVSNQVDVGLEAGFLQERMNIEIDWYRRHTTDIIAAVPIPDVVGSQNSPFVNTAEVLNSGIELAANWRETGTFDYNIGLNFSTVNNKVLALAKGKSEIFDAFVNQEPATHTIVGLPIGALYGYQVEGIFQNAEEIVASPSFGSEKPGDIRYRDNNNDGKLDGKDRVYLGSAIPKFTYGFNLGAGFKGIDFNADFFGVSGNKVYNEKEATRFGVYNWEAHVSNAWTIDNPSASEPRVTNGGHNYRVSDRFIQDGSFFRLRTLSLGYTLSKILTQKVKLESFRIFVSGTNLWTKQSFTGYTPEFPNGSSPFKVGFDNGVYPIAKSIQFGLETKF